jgi:ABC-type antimicrobial peptide transport system permease subunit
MFSWSLKTLAFEPARFVISVFAVAVSFVLVVFFSAVFEGESKQMVRYLQKMDADVWVMQKGVSNMHMASSLLWDWKAERVAKLEGVEDVSAVLYMNGPVKIGDQEWFSYIMGIKPEYPDAGPWLVTQGKGIPGPGEVVIPDVISRLTGVSIGDTIMMVDVPLKVVGLTAETFSMTSSIVFVSHRDLGELIDAKDQLSYVMVKGKDSVTPEQLIAQIHNDLDKVNVMRSDDFIESDWQLAAQMGAEIISLMSIIGTLLAIMIVAFTTYSLVSRKKRELALAKALGFSSGSIYFAALLQSLVITFLGLVFALVLAFTLVAWLPTVVPQVNLYVQFEHFIPLAIVSLPIALIASFVAARAVVKVDPMLVFST